MGNMLVALAVVASLVAYVFIAGVVKRVLVHYPHESTRHAEDLLCGIWPLIPLMAVLWIAERVLEGATKRVMAVGYGAVGLPISMVRWWKARWQLRSFGRSMPRAVARVAR